MTATPPPSYRPSEIATLAYHHYRAEHQRLLDFLLFVNHGSLAIRYILISIGENDKTAAYAKFNSLFGLRGSPPTEEELECSQQILGELVISKFVDLFLAYLTELLTIIFTARPETLRSNEQVRIDFVLNHVDRESLIKALAEKKVESLAYSGMRDLDNYLQERLGLTLFVNDDDREEAIEFIEIRNIVVHNRGFVNELSAKKAPRLRQYIGQPFALDNQHLIRIREFILRLVNEIDERAITKFHLAEKYVMPFQLLKDDRMQLSARPYPHFDQPKMVNPPPPTAPPPPATGQ